MGLIPFPSLLWHCIVPVYLKGTYPLAQPIEQKQVQKELTPALSVCTPLGDAESVEWKGNDPKCLHGMKQPEGDSRAHTQIFNE